VDGGTPSPIADILPPAVENTLIDEDCGSLIFDILLLSTTRVLVKGATVSV
jgi:hypothetical protein